MARTAARRSLRFESLDEILADAEKMAATPHHLSGQWTFGQILEHLAGGIDGFYEGFGFKAPWFVRWIIGPLIKKSLLTKGMTPGFKLPKGADALLPPVDCTTEAGLAHLRQAVERLKTRTPTHPSPFLGPMTPEEVRQLMLRHAELHLSFVVPD